jgi:hypothetical protein
MGNSRTWDLRVPPEGGKTRRLRKIPDTPRRDSSANALAFRALEDIPAFGYYICADDTHIGMVG